MNVELASVIHRAIPNAVDSSTMHQDFWQRVSLYLQGGLGVGPRLEIDILLAYAFSFLCTICVGILSALKWIRPFNTVAMLLVCALPTVLVTPLLIEGFLSNDINAFGLSLFVLIVSPGAWLLPLMTFYYAQKMMRDRAKNVRQTHKLGYLFVFAVEGLSNSVFWYLMYG